MKRSIIIIFHMLAVMLALAGFIMLRDYSAEGRGISWTVSGGSFEESNLFSDMVSSDIAGIKRYAVLKNAFGPGEEPDYQRTLIIADSTNGTITYNVADIVSSGKKFGYSLDENNRLVAGEAAATDNYQVRVKYKAYDPYYFNNIAPGPSQGLMTFKELCFEAMRAMAEYYSLSEMYDTQETNLVYSAYFRNDNGEEIEIGNAGDRTGSITGLPKYIVMNDEMSVSTNIVPQPVNIMPDNATFEYAEMDGNVLELGIDTMYLYSDRYKAASDSFSGYIRKAYSRMALMTAGILLSLVSLVLVVRDTDAVREGREYLIDRLPFEGMVFLMAAAAVLVYALFRTTLYNFMEVLAAENSWGFWCKTAKSVDTYVFCVIIMCSMYRRSKNGGIFRNSLIERALIELTDDNAVNAWKAAIGYGVYFLFNAVCVAGAVLGIENRFASRYYVFAAVILAALCGAVNIFVFIRLYGRSRQRGIINSSLKRISEGDTSYEVPEKGFTGGELEAVRSINSISDGLSRAINEQVKADRLKADLITNVSHDIKTPLTSIINYVDLIKRENIDNEKVKEYIDVLDRKSARLKNLTEDLVEASKASSGNIKMEMCRLNMSELAGQAGGEFEDKFRKRKLEFILNTPEEPAYIMADGRHLWRVFENLLNNAAKYAMENTRIYADVVRENGTCIFTIKNISQDKLNISPDELTERFIRGDVSRSTEGSGLGLSIAKSLTSLMGGRLVIEIDGDLYKAKVILNEAAETETEKNG